jgi:hypothetical protein
MPHPIDTERLARIHEITLPALDDTNDGHEEVASVLALDGAHAEWTDIHERDRTWDKLVVDAFEGTFEHAGMLARATNGVTVEARSLLPGVLYGYRRCVSHCDAGEDDASSAATRRVEDLVVIGPRALWLGTSDDRRVAVPPATAFTELHARVTPGSSSSVYIAASSADVANFAGGLDIAASKAATTTFSVEVIWPTDEAPTITVYRGTFEGDLVDQALTRQPAEPDCVREPSDRTSTQRRSPSPPEPPKQSPFFND